MHKSKHGCLQRNDWNKIPPDFTRFAMCPTTWRSYRDRLHSDVSTLDAAAALVASSERHQLTSEDDDGCDCKGHREEAEAETINDRRQKHPVTCHHLLVFTTAVLLQLHFLHPPTTLLKFTLLSNSLNAINYISRGTWPILQDSDFRIGQSKLVKFYWFQDD